jgi:hypothetical protein
MKLFKHVSFYKSVQRVISSAACFIFYVNISVHDKPVYGHAAAALYMIFNV